MKLIKRFLSVALVFAIALGAVGLVGGSRANAAIDQDVCSGINTVINSDGSVGGTDCNDKANDAEGTFASVVSDLINFFSIVVGAISVIMIIYGGFKYMTSGGSDDKTKDAKNTILYALVGLIIVLLAQTIVKFVFNKALTIGE